MVQLNFRVFFAIVIFHLCSTNQFIQANEAQPKIIIIGAGAAGIAAATNLIDNGFTDVTILEAKSRIGGRIDTVTFGENVIDLGSQFIQGEKGNLVFELASKHNFLGKSTAEFNNYSYIRSNGELVPESIWQRLKDITYEVVECFVHENKDAKGSMGEYMKKKFDELISQPDNADLDKKIAQEYYETYAKDSSSDEGTETLDVISARDYTNYEECDGPGWTWGGKGNIELLNILMDTNKTQKEFGKLAGKIQLSKPVIELQWQRNDGKVLLKTQDETEILADHVIVTVSLGVLKAYSKDLFDPNLPETKQEVIEALGFGLVNKMFLEFKKPFWKADWDGVYFLWREEDLKEIRGTEREWLLDTSGFFTVVGQPNVLLTWITGKGARLMEDLGIKQIKADCLYLLNKFMPSDAKEIVNVKASDWAIDPCFRGALSYHSLETEKANVDNDQLAVPIRVENDKPIIMFAGEATEPTHYSTVHGAIESGQREAKRLQDYYKNAK